MSLYRDREEVVVPKPQGGEGHLLRDVLVPEEAIGGSKLMQITLEPGCAIGYHQHVGDCEAYYILEGKALYNDDGEEFEIGAGDSTFCEEGHWHGIKNIGEGNVRFIALIYK